MIWSLSRCCQFITWFLIFCDYISIIISDNSPRFHPEEFVNTLAGTFSSDDYSTGNTLPLVGMPWGFNHWAVQTIDDRGSQTSSWWFSGNHRELHWFRCTHQPSPWIGDWGWFLFTAMVNDITRSPRYFYEPRGSVFKPYHFHAVVAPYNLVMELTPSSHGAILRVTFPSNVDGKHVCFAQADWDDRDMSPIPHFYGRTRKVHIDRKLVINFNLYMYVESMEAIRILNHDDMICFEYDNKIEKVEVRMTTSLISKEQAKVALDFEIPKTMSFDQALKKSKNIWNKMLSRVEIKLPYPLTEEHNRHLTIFYTSIYRALMFPRRLDELNVKGEVVHYSPYDNEGRTYSGPLCTDNGFWDTFRTVYPMLSLIYPDYLGDIIQGWLHAYREGGWLPSWASPGYRNCMVGTYADVVISDAIVKNIGGFDLTLAVEALQKDAFAIPPEYAAGAMGKERLSQYTSLGYVADDVSRSLDFGFADYATAQAFRSLCSAGSILSQGGSRISRDGQRYVDLSEEQCDQMLKYAKDLISRSEKVVESQFDSKRGLMVPKTSSGSSNTNFNDITWGNGFTEGNSWHHSFPPYALASLVHLYGESGNLVNSWSITGSNSIGKSNLIQKLMDLFTHESNYHVGSYNQEIHEMREMKVLAMGQYGHNNQPCHHIPFLFAMLGKPQLTYAIARQVLNRAYGIDFYAGDEDNGEQGAWFVLAALGLFSITPGTSDYVLSSPLFPYVKIYRGPKRKPDPSEPKDFYEKYSVSKGTLQLEQYNPFRYEAGIPSWPFSKDSHGTSSTNDYNIDSDLQSIEITDQTTIIVQSSIIHTIESDNSAYLHIIANDVSSDSMNVYQVIVSHMSDPNKYKKVIGNSISDGLLQSSDNIILRFVMEKEVFGVDSIADKTNLFSIASVSMPVSVKIPPIHLIELDPTLFHSLSNHLTQNGQIQNDITQNIPKPMTSDERLRKDKYIALLESKLHKLGKAIGIDIDMSSNMNVNMDISMMSGNNNNSISTMLKGSNSINKGGNAIDDQLAKEEIQLEMTWDIYLLLLLAILMSGYLAALLLDIIGITGNTRRSVGAIMGFEKNGSIKARTV